MVIATACFALNDAITKFVSSEINFGQVMLVRSTFAMVLIWGLALRSGAMQPLRTVLLPPTGLRVVCEVGGAITFLAAITHLPLANTYSIFQALPLAVTLGAVVAFSEHVGWRRWLAIAAGFVGVLIIVRPGLAGFNHYSLLVLASVILCAVRDLATKRIPKAIPTLLVSTATAFAMTIVGALLLSPMGGWTPMTGKSTALLALAAVLVLIGYQSIIMAMRVGDISFIAPFRYTALISSILLGLFIFADVPDLPMVIGATIIIGSGLYALYRERIVGRRKIVAESTGPTMVPDGI